jgi:hypothetical protein
MRAISLWMLPLKSTLPDAAAAEMHCRGHAQRHRLPASTSACDKRLSFACMICWGRRRSCLCATDLLPPRCSGCGSTVCTATQHMRGTCHALGLSRMALGAAGVPGPGLGQDRHDLQAAKVRRFSCPPVQTNTGYSLLPTPSVAARCCSVTRQWTRTYLRQAIGPQIIVCEKAIP